MGSALKGDGTTRPSAGVRGTATSSRNRIPRSSCDATPRADRQGPYRSLLEVIRNGAPVDADVAALWDLIGTDFYENQRDRRSHPP
jgi:hypothetical protein